MVRDRGEAYIELPTRYRLARSSVPEHRGSTLVHRGVKDIEKQMYPDTLELQTLTFPECSRPSVINVAFFLAALSEFAAQYHVGEYQACWFAHAALDSFHAAFQGRLHLSANIHAMGKWKATSFKYINLCASIVAEYSRQLKEYEDAFKIIQSAGRRLESHQLGVLHEGHRIGVEEGCQEGIEERRKLEEEIEQRMTERRQLKEEIAKLRASLDAR
ncbi:hypothetical protein DFH08DRAFT_940389 [Mycena albidolilacea]|uniref:Uncharacterized protein n=1 Tax=Mycena albidolilacea TaxID=1033008 RepID=A0AAD6ZNB8_9AGAR|nr:hypothetical protein DFH08DRAFT_940389 [Mycena albidolilacea]